uniref:PPM-type phosphatase domain-containing protein n=1 Tax=Strigamia maritima TaxID=126957 RepID=T1JHL8_STRMM
MDLFGDLPAPSEYQASLDEASAGNIEYRAGTSYKRKAEVDYEQAAKKSAQATAFELRSFVRDRKGEREDMQDAHTICENLHEEIKNLDSSVIRLHFYGVFDGHGGARASKFVADHLHHNIALKFPKGDVKAIEKEIKKSFIDAFKKTDDDFLREATKFKPTWKDGTTVVGMFVINDIMYILNLGDSKAVLARINDKTQSAVAMPLTNDHTPTQYEERMRIQKSGGQVREGRVHGVLEVSRSIGDGQFKSHGVSCVPDIRRCQLTLKDKFVILACDGLWKVFSPHEVVSFVLDVLIRSKVPATDTKTEEDARFEAACTRLTNEAIRRGSDDNITVLIVSINRVL